MNFANHPKKILIRMFWISCNFTGFQGFVSRLFLKFTISSQ